MDITDKIVKYLNTNTCETQINESHDFFASGIIYMLSALGIKLGSPLHANISTDETVYPVRQGGNAQKIASKLTLACDISQVTFLKKGKFTLQKTDLNIYDKEFDNNIQKLEGYLFSNNKYGTLEVFDVDGKTYISITEF